MNNAFLCKNKLISRFLSGWAGRFVAVLSILSLFAFAGCTKKAPRGGLTGLWHGTVLIVDVEFSFEPESYEQRTFSFNRVMIGGTKGSITVKDNIISVNQKYKYFFDNDTNRGEWRKSPATYTIDYKIEGDSITLKPSTSEDSMTLKRAD